MATSFKDFNNKMCHVDFENQEFQENKDTFPALVFDWNTFDNEEIKQFIEDELGDEMDENPKYVPFSIVFMSDIKGNLYNTNLFFENIDYTVAYLMINPKNNKIFRSGWGEVDLKLDNLNIRLKK